MALQCFPEFIGGSLFIIAGVWNTYMNCIMAQYATRLANQLYCIYLLHYHVT